MKDKIIPIDKETDRFSKFLEKCKSKNERIIFSSPFGTGKTYFMHKFFEAKEDYKVFHLFPVNYQIASNEDIFSLLKYDILLKMIDFGFVKNYEEFGHVLAIQNYFINEGGNELWSFLKNLPKIGGGFKSVENLVSFFTKYKQNKKEIEDADALMIETYLSKIRNNEGSIFEFDTISEYINEKISELTIDSILIIDDLDRLDPEHIFRILNVFSAHFDRTEVSNKFGFKKIIIVCDIDNIRNIFHSKYGQKVDFSGYIDKFYTVPIYNYNFYSLINNSIIDNLINPLFEKSRITKPIKDLFEYNLRPILFSFLKTHSLTIRDLKTFISNGYSPLENKAFKHKSDLDYYTETFYGIWLIDFLIKLFNNDINKLVIAIEKSKSDNEFRDKNIPKFYKNFNLIIPMAFSYIKRNPINFELQVPNFEIRYFKIQEYEYDYKNVFMIKDDASTEILDYKEMKYLGQNEFLIVLEDAVKSTYNLLNTTN